MRISTLLKDILPVPPAADREIFGLQLDSRHIQKNDLFLAIKGAAADGRQFIPSAIKKGAIAVLIDANESGEAVTYEGDIPLILVHDLKNKLGHLAAEFYGNPAQKLRMIGVTGTNGKTSCTHFLAQALNKPCGVIGTLGSGLYGHLGEAGLTTPDAVTLQATLSKLLDLGAEMVAMEVSSHSIDQGRINGIDFETGIFTNLTQDHLDYHGTMENYAQVKKRFFAELPTKNIILNADDPYGCLWVKELAKQRNVYAYTCQVEDLNVPTVRATDIRLSLQGIQATIDSPWGKGILVTPIIGEFNLSNILAVLTALCVEGMPLNEALDRIALLNPVPGRMQALSGPKMPLVIVDYAHTPDALEKALKALRVHTQGKLVCVFGCGGDRDSGKRPLMARIAEQLADQVIVTNDNPRHEKPEAIAKQILQGFEHPESVTVMLDRAKAIEKSIQCTTANDCVLIAGKGAERYQQIGDEKTHFDDAEEVRKCIAEKLNAIVVK